MYSLWKRSQNHKYGVKTKYDVQVLVVHANGESCKATKTGGKFKVNKWSDKDTQTVRDGVKEGLSHKDIAAKCKNRTGTQVGNKVKVLGLSKKRKLT